MRRIPNAALRLALRISVKPCIALVFIAHTAGCGPESPESEHPPAVVDTVKGPDGIAIAYETRGTGSPALVFVHGWSCDRRYWEGQLEPFSREHQVVAVDLAGHGESGTGRENWTIESFGVDVATVIMDLGLERVILVGHSMGGDVILETALHLPERLEGLVWVDVYDKLGSPRSLEEIEAIIDPFRSDFEGRTREVIRSRFPIGADGSLVDWVVSDMASAPESIAIKSLESSFSYGRTVTEVIAELDKSIIAINADDSPNDVESLQRHGVDKVVLMSGVGHFLMMEEPEEFNRLLLDVIEGFAP